MPPRPPYYVFFRIYDQRKINENDNNGVLKKFCPSHLVSSESKTNITCLVYSHDGTGDYVFVFVFFFLSRCGLASYTPLNLLSLTDVTAVQQFVEPLLIPLPVQSCWPATTTRTSTCLTPTTATGPTISGDTRDIATTPQVFGPASSFAHLWSFCCTFFILHFLFSSPVKGVNFYGPCSEFVVSGSDCGHIYLWDKYSARIVQFMEGDRGGVVSESPGVGFTSSSAVLGLQRNQIVDKWVQDCF